MTTLKPRTATKVLYQGDDMSRMSELKRAVDIATRLLDQAELEAGQTAARVGDDTAEAVVIAREAKADAQREFDEFVDEAAERAVTIVLQSIGRRRFRDLVAAHPPREVESEPDADGKATKAEHEDDADFGVNTETFPQALLCFRENEFVTIADPKFNSDAEVRAFVDDDLAEGDFDDLWVNAFFLNRGGSADPKDYIGSTSASRSSVET